MIPALTATDAAGNANSQDIVETFDVTTPPCEVGPGDVPFLITDEIVQQGPLSTSYDRKPRPGAPFGVYTINGAGVNVSDISFSEISFVATRITGGNVVLNADSEPAGVGASITLSGNAFGPGGTLSPGEVFTVTALIGLRLNPFR
jgi:hypothetical protein